MKQTTLQNETIRRPNCNNSKSRLASRSHKSNDIPAYDIFFLAAAARRGGIFETQVGAQFVSRGRGPDRGGWSLCCLGRVADQDILSANTMCPCVLELCNSRAS